ncbi:MAG: ASKHA domain-containing protein [Bryobacteraceae bacterium]
MKLTLRPAPGMRLSDQLQQAGVEFPCGGQGICGGCRVRVIEGDIPVTDAMRQQLGERELREGWRLACCANASAPVTVEVEQWSARVLSDEEEVPVEPRPGWGAAVDLGTTTVAAQLVHLETGEVEAVETALNAQARFGADVMSRIQHELKHPGELGRVIRAQLEAMLGRLAGGRKLTEVLLAGNTAMHHLFSGLDVAPLAAAPFLSPATGAQRWKAAEVPWGADTVFLPCLGGFVGSDLLAGLAATRLDKKRNCHVLFDIGTNGEIVAAQRARVRCASTAAGPAFEGGRIRCGMRACEGAIDSVRIEHGRLVPHVIGGGAPRGICGSGLVDAVAKALDLGLVQRNGRLARGDIALAEEVVITQSDVRQLQLAKGAMAAGLKLMARGARQLFLAGAFGNYLHADSARRIGLLPEDAEVQPVGNASLRGTRMLLLSPSTREERVARILAAAEHVELAGIAGFEDVFAESMALEPFRLR